MMNSWKDSMPSFRTCKVANRRPCCDNNKSLWYLGHRKVVSLPCKLEWSRDRIPIVIQHRESLPPCQSSSICPSYRLFHLQVHQVLKSDGKMLNYNVYIHLSSLLNFYWHSIFKMILAKGSKSTHNSRQIHLASLKSKQASSLFLKLGLQLFYYPISYLKKVCYCIILIAVAVLAYLINCSDFFSSYPGK